MSINLKEYLEKISQENAPTDPVPNDPWGFNVFDASGGNYDDAFSMGCDEGRIQLARELLKLTGMEEK